MELHTPERRACEKLWDYLGKQQALVWTIKSVDAMIVAGCRDLGVPREAARLFTAGWAKIMVISGGFHRTWGLHETDAFAQCAIDQGVPESKIIKDYDARNTGDNVKNAQRLLREQGIQPTTLLGVHTPIMTRRLGATIEAQWEGDLEYMTRHEAVSFETYIRREGMDDTIPRMIGYVARMEPYAAQGLQSEQPVPGEIHEACRLLEEAGYVSRGPHE